ncbi:type II toxin-antitoxin system VapC family toxin [Nonomuraea indica]|uniref:Type II toxin-antitoxin system VapC family toxin n=1 Tax=Nonomuraea indica TaxID=1581193 RepID=A0ABW7ZXY8_9ACTN
MLRAVHSADEITLVDSCVLLDIFTEDPHWADWSGKELERASDTGRVVINPIIYAEVTPRFPSIEELEETLPHEEFGRENLPYEAAFLAGQAFNAYKRRGGQKRAPLPDFYIGAHAAIRSYRLLTRDARRFRTYFPKIQLVCPD